MGHLPYIIADLTLLLTTAGVVTLICKKFKQPLVLGYVVAGFLVSPAIAWIPNIVDTTSVQTWSEIGVIFLMFGLGLEFPIMKLTTVGRSAIITALTEMVMMVAVGTAVGFALGWSFFNSLFLGGMLSISSTTIIIKAFEDLGLRGKKFTELVFGVLIVEDVIVIFLMVVLSTIAVGTTFDGSGIFIKLGQMLLYLIVWFMLSIIIVPTVLQRVAKTLNDEIILIISIALCFGMVVLADAIGFSSALGAFIAGSILAGTVQGQRIEKLFKPIKNLFGAVFFVSVGMLVSPQLIAENILPIVIIVVVTLLGQPFFAFIGVLLSGKSFKTALQSGMSLSQIGEFSFIIAALGVSLGVTADYLYPVIVAVSVITTLTTPFYIKNTDRLYALLTRILPQSFLTRFDRDDYTPQEKKPGSLWANYLKHWIIKMLMVIITAVAAVELFTRLIWRPLDGALPEFTVPVLLAGAALVLTGIFIANLFHSDKGKGFAVLWAESKLYHLRLSVLFFAGLIVSCAMVFYILSAFGTGISPWVILPSIAITLLLARSKWLHSRFLVLETRFVANLNERLLAERDSERSDEDRIWQVQNQLFVTRVKVTTIRERRGKRFPTALFFALASNLDLLAIQRCEQCVEERTLARSTKEELHERINNPDEPLDIKEGDILTLLGTKEEIDAFFTNMYKAKIMSPSEKRVEKLHDYLEDSESAGDWICFSLHIDAASDLKGKTIANAGLKENYGCLVVGLERNFLPVTKPSRNTRIAQGDYLILFGDRRVAEFFDSTEDEVLMLSDPAGETLET